MLGDGSKVVVECDRESLGAVFCKFKELKWKYVNRKKSGQLELAAM
jgi:hypothetical protein